MQKGKSQKQSSANYSRVQAKKVFRGNVPRLCELRNTPPIGIAVPHLVYSVNVVHYAVWRDAFGLTAATKDARVAAGVMPAMRHGVDRTGSR